MAAASVAQADTKQAQWTTFGSGASGLFVIGCSTVPHSIHIIFEYRGHALKKVVELEQPIIFEIRHASGENQKFPLIAYMTGDADWILKNDLTGSGATAFLDAFGREGRLSLQTGKGAELAFWTLKDTSKARELMRGACQV